MKTSWLHRNNNEGLIIFYTGWGMDQTPFTPLSSEKYDVLCCYDYSENICRIDLESLAKQYDHINFAGWSMGVTYGQRHFADNIDYFEKVIAINGTLRPVDDLFGIPVDICKATLEALDEETSLKFYRRMCRSSSVFTSFLTNRPQRSVDDIKNELAMIMDEVEVTAAANPMYTDIIISTKDMIIPTKNQIRFWKIDHERQIKHLESSHFPFYLWNSWDEFLEYTG